MGRDQYSRRAVLEASYGIGVRDLLACGLLKPGAKTGTASLDVCRTQGDDSETIAVLKLKVEVYEKQTMRREAGNLSFSWEYQGREYGDTVGILAQRVNFGGFRYFFECPHCSRMIKTVYWYYSTVACRHCARMVYYGCRHHRDIWGLEGAAQYTRKKAAKLRASLKSTKLKMLKDR